ncbi:MAG TPA: DUF2934 domain-containing protein [bacterium]|jgi:hypothetical protein|nr:DUF2934 domain-containing protein [bacterium]
MVTKKSSKAADSAAALSARIHEVAYERWVERGRPHDTALEDWLHAEGVIVGREPKMKKAPAAPRKKAVKVDLG